MHKILLIHIFLLIPNCLFCIKSFNSTDKDELWDLLVNGKIDDEIITTTDSSSYILNNDVDYDIVLGNFDSEKNDTTDVDKDESVPVDDAEDAEYPTTELPLDMTTTLLVFEDDDPDVVPELISNRDDKTRDTEKENTKEYLADVETQHQQDESHVPNFKKQIQKVRYTPTSYRPKPGQRSLVIVFDGTGSMIDDLEQLIHGAELIIAEITKKKDNPIYNYIFVPFRDPAVGPMLITTKQDELMKELKNMTLWGGGDCPESALAGIKMALEKALPGSFVYVFTDAIAKDFKLYTEVLDLVQQKQTPITFLSTGFCNSKNSSGYAVFEKLASASNGQVYDLKKTDIAEVLESVRQLLDIKRVSLKSVDFEEGQPFNVGLEVDKSLKEFSVSVAGNKPNITFTDPMNQNYKHGKSILNLNNLQVVNVQDPIPGKWNIVAESENGGGSVRVSGISDVAFRFGFAVEQPNDIVETSYRPLSGTNNILTISPSDMSVIKNLTHITIDSFASNSDANATKFQFKLPLKQLNSSMLFTTDPFPPPRQMFKVFVHGYDVEDNPLERLVSTVIQSIENSPPEVSIEQPKLEVLEFNEIHFKCSVVSLTPVTITLRKSNEVLKKMESKQSNVLEHTIDSADLKNSGRYTCLAVNSAGTTESLSYVTVKPRAIPVVNVYPQIVQIIEFDQPIEIHCSVENADENTRILWNFNTDALEPQYVQPNNTVYIPITSRNFTGKYSCIAISYSHEIVDSASVVIEYPTMLLEPSSENTSAPYGTDLELSCQSQGVPTPTTNWYFTQFDTEERQQLMNEFSYFSIHVTAATEGEYVCEVDNGIGGPLMRTMIVSGTAVTPPMLHKTNNTYVVANAGDDVSLSCTCELCKPLRTFSWSSDTVDNLDGYENIRIEKQNFTTNEFELVLQFRNVTEANQGMYRCLVSNEYGSDLLLVELNVLVPPQIEKLVATNANETDDGSINVVVGSSTYIKCLAKGSPMPVVQWNKDGVPILDSSVNNNSSSLTIEDAQFNDAGVYSCQAINSLGTITKQFTLLVLGPPRLTKSKTEPFQSVVSGQNIQLPCEVQAVPPPQITWLLNGHNLGTSSRKIIDANNSLMFNANDDDSGIYECRAINEFGEISQKLVLVIYTMPAIYPATDEVVKVKSNSDVVMRCYASGNPFPEISWNLDGTKMINTTEVQIHKNGELKLTNVTERNAGAYVCDAFNGIGTSQKIFYVVVNDPPTITSEFSGKLLLTPNQSIKLECQAFGNPVPKIYWMRNDVLLTESNILEIMPNATKPNGNYTCHAENSEGTDTRCVEIQAITPPKMKRDINDTLTKVSSSMPIDLTCPYEGYKKITWFKNDVEINDRKHSKLTVRDGILSFQSTVSDDRGTYVCLVENEAGQANYTFTLEVTSSPFIHSDKTYTSNDITENDDESNIEITFLEGEDFHLNCKANGHPAPEISWLKDDEVVSVNSELSIPNVIAEDEGIYTCTAENSEGEAKKSYHVNVRAKPTYHYGDLDQYIELSVGEDLTLDCTMAGNPHPTIMWFLDGKYLEEYQEILEYKRVTKKHAGVYKCSGRNSGGTLDIYFHVKIHEPPKIIHFTETLSVHEGNSGKLLCIVKGHPNPSVSILQDGVAVLSTARIMQTTETMEQFTSHGEIIIDEYGNGMSVTVFPTSDVLNRMKKYGKLIRNGDKDEMRFEFVIPKIRRTHNGTFTCVATNALGSGNAESSVIVHVPPYFTENKHRQQNIEVVEGLPIILTCPLHGLPQPKISWLRNNVLIQPKDDTPVKILNHGSILSISAVIVNDTGAYECIGENQAGRSNLKYNVNVLVLPRFVGASPYNNNDDIDSNEDAEFEPILVYTEKGRDVQLKCAFSGNPAPTVFWVELNFEDASQNELLDTIGPVLNLTSVQETSSFNCYGNNTVGFKEKLFHVIVQTAPTFEKPYAEQVNVNLYLGINLECKVSGTPEPSVTWSKDGNEILGNNKQQYSTSQDEQILRILNAKKSDAGTYVCEAENVVGRARKSISLDVKVPVSWSPWRSWSPCSASCGKGTKTRTRFCIQPNGLPARNEDYNCVGENIDVQICEIIPCPINGGWSRWGAWSGCSESCLTEHSKPTRRRLRKCNSPVPGLGGRYCPGTDIQEEICDVPHCPIDGGWTDWSKWSTCSSTCGHSGVTTRNRWCQKPLPQWGGHPCPGSAQESKICSPKKPCPINGGWSKWSDWGACSKTCGTGVHQRKRKCNSPEPKYEGLPCVGENVEIENCRERLCKNNDLLKQIKNEGNKYGPSLSYDNGEEEQSQEIRRNNNYQYFHTPNVEYIVRPTQTIVRLPNGQKATGEVSGYSQPRAVITVENSIPLTKDVTEINFNAGSSAVRRSPSQTKNGRTQCVAGFHFDDLLQRCADTDECKLVNICKSSYKKCVNTVGGYNCVDVTTTVCPSGFRNINSECLDVNECSHQSFHNCSHYCENTHGSYTCKCPTNYHLDESGKQCFADSQQDDSNTGKVVAEKHHMLFKSNKICPEGFKLFNEKCEDANECQNDQHTCDTEQTCLNTKGSYLCVPTPCPDDYENKGTFNNNQCIQECNRQRSGYCTNGASTANIINYHVVSIDELNYRLPIVKLVNYDLSNLPIERTTFSFIESSSDSSAFRLEKIADKQGIVYMYANEGMLKKEKIYKLKVLGQSYKTGLSYATTSIVYVYVQN